MRLSTAKRVVVLGGGQSYAQKVKALFGSSLIQYLPMNETSGTTAVDASGNGRTGTYSGVILANTPAPAKIGGLAPFFDGINDFVNLYSVSLATAFNGNEGTFAFWIKSADWTLDNRYALNLFVDSSNYIVSFTPISDNQLFMRRIAAGTTQTITLTSMSGTSWYHIALVWSVSGNYLRAYKNGVQVGTDTTGLPTFSGSLNSTRTLLGAFTTIDSLFNGWLSHYLLLNRPATATEIANLYNWGA